MTRIVNDDVPVSSSASGGASFSAVGLRHFRQVADLLELIDRHVGAPHHLGTGVRVADDPLCALAEPLFVAGVALCRLGCFEPAGVIFGKADGIGTRNGPDWALDMSTATDAALLEALDEQQAASLAARGAALDYADAIAYLRAQTKSVLQDT